MKFLIPTLTLYFMAVAGAAFAKPTAFTVDSDVNPGSKPFSKCYQKAKNLRINKKDVLTTAQLVTAFKKAPNYPESEKASKVEACVFIVYDVLPDGKADNVRVMEAEPRTPAFTTAAIARVMDAEFEKKKAEDQAVILTFRAK